MQTVLRSFTVLVVLAAACAGAAAADVPLEFQGREFVRTPDGWVQLDPTGQGFKVDPASITVRFAEGIDDLDAFRDALRAAGAETDLIHLDALRVNGLGIHDLALATDQDPLDVAMRLQATGLVRFAEPTTIGTWSALPSDPQFSNQYHLRNTGQTGGTGDADIDADEAWDVNAGSPAVVVGVLDSGTDIDHVDLVDNLWKNSGETPGNGQDDDGNGFVDDYDGWDFEGNDGNPRSSNGHGTQVGGIVAARTDNGIGVSGIAGGFGAAGGARLMIVKVGTSGPIGSILDDAIYYAADNGADVITMSLSVGASSAIDAALDYAYNTKGVFIDCASGNNYSSSVSYPARNPNVMAVGATDHNDNRASYSNYGTDLELVAPGSSIRSTGLNDTYVTGSGTSFAAPGVAGVAALILSRNGSLTNDQVRQTLKDTCDDVGAVGQDLQTGAGRINALAALQAVGPADCEDGDGDGFFPVSGCNTELDCDDSDDQVYPGAPEVCSDGVDQDCDGVDRTKGKGCGGGGGDAKENCKNGVDDDGDGLVDCLDGECSGKKFCN
jgi:subtilisin family serine protease